jgi:hypothetical protein
VKGYFIGYLLRRDYQVRLENILYGVSKRFWYLDIDGDKVWIDNATAWMKLPEPYKIT